MTGEAPEGMACSPEEGCALCGDVAVPARVLRVDPSADMATVIELHGEASTNMTVALDLVDGVVVGDVVLVHQGFAIERVRP